MFRNTYQNVVDSPRYVYEQASSLYEKNVVAFYLILIVLVLVVVYVLKMLFGKQEGFDSVQRWPFLPKPKYWDDSRYFHWDPWYIYDFGYHPATPAITTYDTSTYKFPPEVLARFKKPTPVVPEEVPVQETATKEHFRSFGCSSCL